MNRCVGTVVRGIRMPIIKRGDNLVELVFDSLIKAVEFENIDFKDRDVVAVTESLVARAQGNYATVDEIAKDITLKYPNDIGLVFPILSRNRFSIILKAIAQTNKKMYILLSYPSDEVGNHIISPELLYKKDINPYSQVLTEQEFRNIFGDHLVHEFTGIDYVNLYKEICAKNNVEILFSNDPRTILEHTKDILDCEIHSRNRTKEVLKDSGANIVYGLDEILNESIDGSGYNSEYGLLGSNLATESSVKLFPRNSQEFAESLQKRLVEYTNKNIEVMVYGDGAFKDPVGKIWELADPVVSPGHTQGLLGKPNELKIKYLADTELAELSSTDAAELLKNKIINKQDNISATNDALGTTPRNLTDLLGSLADLTSGSGDKGTPVVLIQGYFDNYADN